MPRTCGAHAKSSGRPCRQPVARGRTRCRFHGGASPPPGPSHPTWKDGRYSKLLRRRAREPDRDLLSNLREIAVLDARADQLAAEIAEEAEYSPDAMRRAVQSIRSADTDEERRSALASLISMAGSAGRARSQWAELRSVIRDRSKLAASERSLRLQEDGTILEAEFLSYLIRIWTLIEECAGEEHRHRLARELAAIAQRQPDGAIPHDDPGAGFVIESQPAAPA